MKSIDQELEMNESMKDGSFLEEMEKEDKNNDVDGEKIGGEDRTYITCYGKISIYISICDCMYI